MIVSKVPLMNKDKKKFVFCWSKGTERLIQTTSNLDVHFDLHLKFEAHKKYHQM